MPVVDLSWREGNMLALIRVSCGSKSMPTVASSSRHQLSSPETLAVERKTCLFDDLSLGSFAKFVALSTHLKEPSMNNAAKL